VRRIDGFRVCALGADAADLADRSGSVPQLQGMKCLAECGRESLVGSGQGSEGRVATAGFGNLEDPEKGG